MKSSRSNVLNSKYHFFKVVVVLLGALFYASLFNSCRNHSQVEKAEVLLRLKVVAQQTGFQILSFTGQGDSLSISNKDLNQVAEAVTNNQKNMQFVISPYKIGENDMIDLTFAKAYLIYKRGNEHCAVKVWPIGK